MRRYRRKPRKPLTFWEAVKKYGFWNNLFYRIRKARISPWFYLSIIMMIIIPIILAYYYIDILVIIFYLFEIIAVGYLVWKLLKKLDRIRVNRRNHLRLFGLKMLSGLVSAFGIILLVYVWISFPFAFIGIIYNSDSLLAQIFTFGSQWNVPYIIPLFLEVFGLGLCIIGAYLFFKFQRLTGRFVWFGRI